MTEEIADRVRVARRHASRQEYGIHKRERARVDAPIQTINRCFIFHPIMISIFLPMTTHIHGFTPIPLTSPPAIHLSSPRTPQKPHDPATIPHQPIQPLPLPPLVPLPLLQRLQQRFAREHDIKVQPQKHRHPRLRQLIIPPRGQPARQRPHKVEQFVGGVGPGAEGEAAQLEVGGGGGEGFEVVEEFGI